MPKIVDKAKRKSEIAAVALNLFAQKGFESTTLQNIADAAGLGKGTLYHYFKSKGDMLKNVADEIMMEYVNALGNASMRQSDPAGQLKDLLWQGIEISGHMEHLFVVYLELWLINMRNNQYGDFMATLESLLNDYRQAVVDIIEDGKKKNIFRKDADSKLLSRYLVASIDGIYMHHLLDKQNVNIKDTATEFLKFFFNGLLKEKVMK